MANKPVNHVAIAERIVQFFEANAGVGNTKAILDGARRTQANILVVSEDEKGFKGVKAAKQISFDEVLAGQLGSDLTKGFPLVMDNAAVVELLSGLLADLDRLAKAVQGKKAKKETTGE